MLAPSTLVCQRQELTQGARESCWLGAGNHRIEIVWCLVLPSASSQGNQPLNIIEQFLVLENHTGLVSLLYPTDGARDPPDAAGLAEKPLRTGLTEFFDRSLRIWITNSLVGWINSQQAPTHPIWHQCRCYPKPTFYTLFLLNSTFWSNVSIVIPIFLGSAWSNCCGEKMFVCSCMSVTVMTVATCGNVWAIDFSRVSTTSLDAGVSFEPPPGG